MIRTTSLIPAALAAGIVMFSGIAAAASITPHSTDEARAQAAARTAAAQRAAPLRPFPPLDSETVAATDTDSARQAASQAIARQSHERYLSAVHRAGAGIEPVLVSVTDTDSARAAATQNLRQQQLLADAAAREKVLATASAN